MARFVPKTFSTILRTMANAVVARTDLTDLSIGGVIHSILVSVAYALDDAYFQMTNLMRIWSIDTATEEDLDRRAADYEGLGGRLTATYATGAVVFGRTGTTGTVAIALGSRIKVPGGGPQFATTTSGQITDGDTVSGSIPIIAVVSGDDGNVDAATVTQMDPIAGVETVINAANTSGGNDQELDAQFRVRIKLYVRSLARGTPAALRYAAMLANDSALGRVVSAQVLELNPPDLGTSYVYVDDGTGTIETTDSITIPEVVLGSATGGEQRLFLDNKPIPLGQLVALELNGNPLVENTDYTLNRASSQITFDSGVFPTGLAPTDNVQAISYTYYTGLIALAQKYIDGDEGDPTDFPGYRAAGTLVFVMAPAVLQQTIVGAVSVEDGFVGTAVRASATSAVIRYINALGIGDDMIHSELIHAVQSVAGVNDISFSSPTSNVVVGDGELARVIVGNVTLS